jgi:hypothetical protein
MGPEFERAVITRERGNPDFAFLWEPESRDGTPKPGTVNPNPFKGVARGSRRPYKGVATPF